MSTLYFLEAANARPLSKTFTDNGPISYPQIKNFNSHEFEYDTLEDMYNLIVSAGNKGWCLLKGSLHKPLIEESRKGKVDRHTSTALLVLDIDGLKCPDELTLASDRIPENYLAAVDAYCMSLLPPEFLEVSRIFQASSSFGMKPGKLSGHMFFKLHSSVAPHSLKAYITQLNYLNPILEGQISLSVTGTALSYVIDPSIADNSRLIYIAPPRFTGKQKDPITTSRTLYVQRQHDSVKINEALATVPAATQVVANKKINKLRQALGIRVKKTKTKEVKNSEGEVSIVVTNPDPMNMQYAEDDERYVRYNINTGDSNAYWVHKYNPEIVHNFKGEPEFLFSKADPDTYKWHCRTYQLIAEGLSEEGAAKELFGGRTPMIFQDYATSKYHYGFWDYNINEADIHMAKSERNLANFLADLDLEMPENVPVWRYEFRPDNPNAINIEKKFLNKYQMPKHLMNPVPISEDMKNLGIGVTLPVLQQHCPIVYAILLSICGNGIDEAEYFVNWIANIVQNRTKALTAWVFHGVPGTGKGLFYHHVLSPLIGQKYCSMKMISDIEEKFNAWAAENLLFVIDEVKINNRNMGIINRLKNIITEPRGTIRGMFQEQADADLYANVLFFSNDKDALVIQEGDRRYNVAPRQTKPLLLSNPEITTDPELLPKLQKEVSILASILLEYYIDKRALVIPLENLAKHNMKLASEDTIDSFVRALKGGDLEFFVPILEEKMRVTGEDWTVPAKLVVKKLMREYKPKTEGLITLSELMPMYNTLCGKLETKAKFKKMLEHHGLEFDRKRMGDAGIAQLCIPIIWKIADTDIQRLRKYYLSDEYDQKFMQKEEHA